MPDESPVPRSSPGEWALAGLLAFNLGWTTINLGGVRAETMVAGSVLTGVALVWQMVAMAWAGERSHPASLWFLPFLIYAAVNVLVITPVPWLGKRDWLGWAQMAAIFWVSLNGLRRPGPRLLVLGTLVGLGAIAVVLAAYQRFVWPDWLMMGRVQVDQYIGRSSGFFGNPNSLGALMVLIIPPMLALSWQRGASAVQRVFFGYLAAVFLLALGLSISRGCLLALIGAFACWPLFARGEDWAARVLWSVTAFGAALLVGIVVYTAAPSIKSRFDTMAADRGERSRPIMWQAAGEMFAQAPVLGTGGGSYNTLFERYRPERFNDEPEWAHNEYLNTLGDYGLVGFVLSFGAVGAMALKLVGSRDRRTSVASRGWRAAGVTTAVGVGLLAFFLACAVDFHLRIPALGMAAALLGAEFVRRNWAFPESGTGTAAWQIVHGLGAAGGLLGSLALSLPTYQAEAIRWSGRSRINAMALVASPGLNLQRTTLSEARARFAEALALDESNAQAWADSAYASALWSHLAAHRTNELGREAERAAKMALAQSVVVAEFWIRFGVALDMQGRWTEGGMAFMSALQLAPANPLVWYHHAYHLSLNPAGKELALSAVDTCLRLDPKHAGAKALRQRLTSVP